jgi:hypothetical protein
MRRILFLSLLCILIYWSTITPPKSNAIDLGQVWNFNYTGFGQTFTIPEDGMYRLEVWGAEGGTDGSGTGGRGGTARGLLELDASDVLNIYIGERGVRGSSPDGGNFPGGFNGGGSGHSNNGYHHASGGGATDIRVGGISLANRVIVAGGGGGGDDFGSSKGGAGGGLTGVAGNGTGTLLGVSGDTGKGGSQTTGGTSGGSDAQSGALGRGGNGSTGFFNGGSGGGGGYYGGGGGHLAAGGGGSSYVGNLMEGSTSPGVQNGNGRARITYLGPPPPWLDDPTELVNVIPSINIFNDTYVFETNNPDHIYFKIDDSVLQTIKQSNKDLMISSPNFSIKIPKRVIKFDLSIHPTGYKVLEASHKDDLQKDEIRNYLQTNDTSIEHLGRIFTFKLYNYESSSSSYDYTMIKNFTLPLTIELKNLVGLSNLERTGVFYVEPRYNNEILVDVKVHFAGNAIKFAEDSTQKNRILFSTDHFSFYMIRESKSKIFQDLNDASPWARDSIVYLSSLNILNGLPGNNFAPQSNVSRVDFSVGLNKSLGHPPASYQAVFNDVNNIPSHYFAGDIVSLTQRQIPDTYAQPFFGVYIQNNPSLGRRNITREEVAVFLGNSYLYESQHLNNFPKINLHTLAPPSNRYLDASLISASARPFISLVYETRLMIGEGSNGNFYFSPNREMKREEYAVVLANFLKSRNYALTSLGGISQ